MHEHCGLTRSAKVSARHKRACFSAQVQHPGLRDSFAADAATVEALVTLFTWLFPGFEYSWLVDEVKHGLPKVCSLPLALRGHPSGSHQAA